MCESLAVMGTTPANSGTCPTTQEEVSLRSTGESLAVLGSMLANSGTCPTTQEEVSVYNT